MRIALILLSALLACSAAAAKRHGTTTLFAALNTLDGCVISMCQPWHAANRLLRGIGLPG